MTYGPLGSNIDGGLMAETHSCFVYSNMDGEDRTSLSSDGFFHRILISSGLTQGLLCGHLDVSCATIGVSALLC